MGTVTISPNNYSVYGDSAGADAYLLAKIGSTWAALSATAKAQALVTATRLIRNYIKAVTGEDVDPATNMDADLADADYELAYALSTTPSIADNINAGNNQKRVKAGSAEVEYFRPVDGGRFPVQVQAFLNSWLSDHASAASISSPFTSGTDQCSTITGHDFQLVEGY